MLSKLLFLLIYINHNFIRITIIISSNFTWWARGSVRAGWAAAGYLSANGCRVWSTRRFLCWTFKKKLVVISIRIINIIFNQIY
ncbi:hypothetical protein Hanom_Chr00s000004g01607331 [Helianthus anomalus]